MKKQLSAKITLLVLLISILTGCAGIQTAPPPKSPIRIEFTQWWGDYTLLVAQEKGFFEKHGIQVEPVYYNVFSDTYPDLASGQIDGALIAVGDTININNNTDLKALAVSDDGSFMPIVARPEINSTRDLKGKKIGTLVGSQYELLTAKMLQDANIRSDEVSFIATNPEDAVTALSSNQVQAVFTWEPFLSDAIGNGNKVIYPTDRSLRLFPDMIVFQKSLIEKRPEDIRSFLLAWFEAVDYRLQNPQETRSIAAKYLGIAFEEVQPDDNLKIFTLADNKSFFNVENKKSIYAVSKTTSDYFISIGIMANKVDLLELLDPKYLP